MHMYVCIHSSFVSKLVNVISVWLKSRRWVVKIIFIALMTYVFEFFHVCDSSFLQKFMCVCGF